MSKILSISEKMDYIREFSHERQENRERFKENDLAYEYLYDVVTNLIDAYTKKMNLSSDIKQDIKQSVILNFLKRNLNPKNSTEFTYLRTYLIKSIYSEISNLSRSEYFSVGIVNFSNLDDFLYIPDNFTEFKPLSSNMDKMIEIESACKVMIRRISQLLKETPLDTVAKSLLLFPILRCIVTKDHSILKSFPYRTKIAIKELIYEVGEPHEYLQH